MVTHHTPKEGEDLLHQSGNMQASKNSPDRLPKILSRHWEAQREDFEETMRIQEMVPTEAATLSVGGMVPMKDGAHQAKRMDSQTQGKQPRGPAG